MLKFLLIPLSWIYRAITSLRNALYDHQVLKSREFQKPVISVGNITVGGTGKTPHTEYIVNLLCQNYNVAILSRGYRRKTKGYLKATPQSTVKEIGDEPKQMSLKFCGKAQVYVCEDRCKGIDNIIAEGNENQVIVLDDAYQHRSVTPRVNILLTDYNRPIFEDHLLPYGRLRESASKSNRANIIIVTKCPEDLKPIDRRVIAKHLNLLPFQSIFFTNYKYLGLKSVFGYEEIPNASKDTNILLVTGIANPQSLINHITKNISEKITHIEFADHHNFKKKDISKITEKFLSLPSDRIIITTEKDAVRLRELDLTDEIKKAICYIPVEINFIYDDAEELNIQILKHVDENKTDYRLHTTVHQF